MARYVIPAEAGTQDSLRKTEILESGSRIEVFRDKPYRSDDQEANSSHRAKDVRRRQPFIGGKEEGSIELFADNNRFAVINSL